MSRQSTRRLVTAENIFRPKRPIMDLIFDPTSIAVVGASESSGSVGQKLMENLKEFPGRLYPVNPNRMSVSGMDTFRSITAIGREIDLAIIATPAHSVPQIVRECAGAGAGL